MQPKKLLLASQVVGPDYPRYLRKVVGKVANLGILLRKDLKVDTLRASRLRKLKEALFQASREVEETLEKYNKIT